MNMHRPEAQGASSEGFLAEEDRIRAAYARRGGDKRYSWLNPGHLFIVQQRERKVLEILKQQGFEGLDHTRILEIGCGSGYWILEFVKWGARPENIVGIDMLPNRIAMAREACPPGVVLECRDAVELDAPDASFDLVLQSTVFTSILADNMRRSIAAQMLRVLKPDGLILWYDYHVNNPSNADVRAIKKREIVQLFPNTTVMLERVTLAPPVARLVARYSWLLCYLLERIPWMRTHYIGVIRKTER